MGARPEPPVEGAGLEHLLRHFATIEYGRPICVTGAGGFVGGQLLTRLAAAGIPTLALVRRAPAQPLRADCVRYLIGDIERRAELRRAFRDVPPSLVFHLAALANPRAAAADPAAAWRANVGGTLNVLLAAASVRARVLLASTALVYGRRAGRFAESAVPAPDGVYAATKLAAERLVRRFAATGGQACIARPFNHSGAGQSLGYVLPAFAAKLAAACGGSGRIEVGNLEPRRDFSHVDDVLDGYARILVAGESGAVYNVCSGVATRIGELLEGLARRMGIEAAELERRVTGDPARLRTDEPIEIVGDPGRLAALGHRPSRGLDYLLDEVAAAALAAAPSRG